MSKEKAKRTNELIYMNQKKNNLLFINLIV